jgi:hypothetical protein
LRHIAGVSAVRSCTSLVLWHIDPLLGNDRETNETAAVAGQRPARNSESTVGSGVFYVVRSEVIRLARPSLVQLVQCG